MTELKVGDLVRVLCLEDISTSKPIKIGDVVVVVLREGTSGQVWGIRPFDHIPTGVNQCWWLCESSLEKVDG